MNGAHDLGGKHGFGPVDYSQSDNFPEDWEASVFSLTLACGLLGRWNLDQSRYARERMDPAHYLASSYYEHWLHGLELLLLEHELVTEAELGSGHSQQRTALGAVSADKLQPILAAGGPTLLPCEREQRFCQGDVVLVQHDNPVTHTRAPGYVKGKTGEIVAHRGAHIFADEHSNTGRKVPEHLYTVRFEAVELWGKGNADHQSAVFVDLFEPYLRSGSRNHKGHNNSNGEPSR